MEILTHEHEDRDRILARADIVEIAELTGSFRRSRWKALHHTGHGEDRRASASIRNGRIHCFTCNRSWDVFDLIMEARAVDFSGALRWLAGFYSVPLNRNLTEREKREYACRRVVAEQEAAGLVAWRDGLIEALRDARNVYFHAYHRAVQYIIQNGLDAPAGNLAADAAELYEVRYMDLDQRIGRLRSATFAELLPHFRASRAKAVAA